MGRKYGYTPSTISKDDKEFKVEQTMKLPNEYSFMKYLPKVLNQGSESICVPCSISAYLNWKLNLRTSRIEDNDIDIYKLYSIRKAQREDGMEIKEALSYIKKEGIKTLKGNVKIKGFSRVGSIEMLKYALVMNGICIGALPVYNSNYDDFWNKTRGNFEGGHAIAIVGYDKKGFIIRNSWGASFGKKGYCHLNYEDFDLFYEIWTIL